MKRWRVAGAIAAVCIAWVLAHHASARGMLADSDTAVLLHTVAAKHAPFSWFLSDWPLYNHFYRPVPTLLFELDQTLFGNNASGYGWTNALLCGGCVAGVFWLLREVFDRPGPATFGVGVFALWQTDSIGFLSDALGWGGWAVLALGAVRHRKEWRAYVPGGVSVLLLQLLLLPLQPLSARTLGWLPGRTATSMTLLGLVALAAYARYERLRTKPTERAPSPLDPPATKSSRTHRSSSNPLGWAALSAVATMLALASYEQAVTLPACLLAVAIFCRLNGSRPRWSWQILSWGSLIAYACLRKVVIPAGRSQYQAQQFRSSLSGAWISFLDVAFPLLGATELMAHRVLDEQLLIFFTPSVYSYLLVLAVTLWGVILLKPVWKLALLGWVICCVGFAPMALLKMFEHYYYWPMALRTVLVAAAGVVAAKNALTALSPRELQAPPRLDPAPGSLPRR